MAALYINLLYIMFDSVFYFSVNFIFTFTFDGKSICCKLFSEIKLLTYFNYMC